MPLQHCERVSRGFWRNCNEQAAGCLRIEKQILKLGRDVVGEYRAISNECAVIFQATGKMTTLCVFNCAGKIFERCVIDFERNYVDVARRITKGHFPSVAEQTESGDIGYSVNRIFCFRFYFKLLQRKRCGAI